MNSSDNDDRILILSPQPSIYSCSDSKTIADSGFYEHCNNNQSNSFSLSSDSKPDDGQNSHEILTIGTRDDDTNSYMSDTISERSLTLSPQTTDDNEEHMIGNKNSNKNNPTTPRKKGQCPKQYYDISCVHSPSPTIPTDNMMEDTSTDIFDFEETIVMPNDKILSNMDRFYKHLTSMNNGQSIIPNGGGDGNLLKYSRNVQNNLSVIDIWESSRLHPEDNYQIDAKFMQSNKRDIDTSSLGSSESIVLSSSDSENDDIDCMYGLTTDKNYSKDYPLFQKSLGDDQNKKVDHTKVTTANPICQCPVWATKMKNHQKYHQKQSRKLLYKIHNNNKIYDTDFNNNTNILPNDSNKDKSVLKRLDMAKTSLCNVPTCKNITSYHNLNSTQDNNKINQFQHQRTRRNHKKIHTRTRSNSIKSFNLQVCYMNDPSLDANPKEEMVQSRKKLIDKSYDFQNRFHATCHMEKLPPNFRKNRMYPISLSLNHLCGYADKDDSFNGNNTMSKLFFSLPYMLNECPAIQIASNGVKNCYSNYENTTSSMLSLLNCIDDITHQNNCKKSNNGYNPARNESILNPCDDLGECSVWEYVEPVLMSEKPPYTLSQSCHNSLIHPNATFEQYGQTHENSFTSPPYCLTKSNYSTNEGINRYKQTSFDPYGLRSLPNYYDDSRYKSTTIPHKNGSTIKDLPWLLERQIMLQREKARLALSQAPSMAKMQLEVEKESEKLAIIANLHNKVDNNIMLSKISTTLHNHFSDYSNYNKLHLLNRSLNSNSIISNHNENYGETDHIDDKSSISYGFVNNNYTNDFESMSLSSNNTMANDPLTTPSKSHQQCSSFAERTAQKIRNVFRSPQSNDPFLLNNSCSNNKLNNINNNGKRRVSLFSFGSSDERHDSKFSACMPNVQNNCYVNVHHNQTPPCWSDLSSSHSSSHSIQKNVTSKNDPSNKKLLCNNTIWPLSTNQFTNNSNKIDNSYNNNYILKKHSLLTGLSPRVENESTNFNDVNTTTNSTMAQKTSHKFYEIVLKLSQIYGVKIDKKLHNSSITTNGHIINNTCNVTHKLNDEKKNNICTRKNIQNQHNLTNSITVTTKKETSLDFPSLNGASSNCKKINYNSNIDLPLQTHLEKLSLTDDLMIRAHTLRLPNFPNHILAAMTHCQLQTLTNAFLEHIEVLNTELVDLLITRDELHMEQDSILVDIEDLTGRVKDKTTYYQQAILLMQNQPNTDSF